MHIRFRSAGVVLGAGLLLSGCVTTGQLADTGPADACGAERAALGESDGFFERSIIQGAAIGAFTGALAGAIYSAVTDGDVEESALIGAGTGALAGGVAGYYNARARNAADQQALVSAIGHDVYLEAEAIDRATVTFRGLKQCRFRQADAIKADYAAGRIGRAEAEARLAEVRALFDEELAVAERLGASMDRRSEELQAASNQLLADDPQARAVAAALVRETGGAVGGPRLTAQVASNVRARPTTASARIGGLSQGEEVVALEPERDGWVLVRSQSGLTGYVAANLFDPGRGRAPAIDVRAHMPDAAPETVGAVEVALATESSQKRRQSFHQETQIAQAEAETVFNLAI